MVAEIKTEHPHIVVIERPAGPCAVIEGTRLSVWLIMRYLRAGDTPEDIVYLYPQLSLAQVHDAISYYHDHRDEIDPIINEADRLEEEHRPKIHDNA